MRRIIRLALIVLGAQGGVVSAHAQHLNDYQAFYQLLAADSETELGSYHVALEYQPETRQYRLSAEIQFSYPLLFSTERYRYRDEVLYRRGGEQTFTIEEQRNDRLRRLTGRPDLQRDGLLIETTVNGKRQAAQFIARSGYDYSLFALRFPKPCGRERVGQRISSRLLNPGSGEIAAVVSEYVSFGSAQPPTFTAPVDNVCLIVTKSDSPEMNKRSWVTRHGYLLFEESSSYRLRLIGDRSTLPSQPQGAE